MSTNQASFPVAAMARVLGVSTAGYYAWRGRPPSAHAQADSELLTRVRTIHTRRGTCMARRVCMSSSAQTVEGTAAKGSPD